MSVNRIASRYAKSLIDLAQEQKQLDAVLEDIKHFSEAVKNRDLELLIKSPIVNQDNKKKVFEALFTKKYSKLTNAFMDIVLRKGREQFLPEIAASFLKQYKDIKHISSVIITTAEEWPKSKIEELKAKLLKSSITDENIELETRIDPSIIGGFVMQIGDNLYDASVAHKLDELKKEFTGNLFVKSI